MYCTYVHIYIYIYIQGIRRYQEFMYVNINYIQTRAKSPASRSFHGLVDFATLSFPKDPNLESARCWRCWSPQNNGKRRWILMYVSNQIFTSCIFNSHQFTVTSRNCLFQIYLCFVFHPKNPLVFWASGECPSRWPTGFSSWVDPNFHRKK